MVESEDDPFLFLENPKVGVCKRFIVGLRRLVVKWWWFGAASVEEVLIPGL